MTGTDDGAAGGGLPPLPSASPPAGGRVRESSAAPLVGGSVGGASAASTAGRSVGGSTAVRLGGQRPTLWTRQYLLALFGTFSFFACFFYLTTTLPGELVERGASALEVGLVVGGYSLIPIFLRPFVGRWSDAGKRILLMRVGLLSFAGSFALMIFVEDIWILFALRCVHGISMAAYPTAAGSFVAEIVPTPRRGEGLGFFGLSTSAAQTFFPMLGGILFAFLGGFDAVLIVAVFTAIASFVLTFFKREPAGSGAPAPRMSLKTLVPPPAVFPMFVFLSITLTFSVAAAFLPSLEDADPNRNFGGPEGIGIFFFLFSGLGATATFQLAWDIGGFGGGGFVHYPILHPDVAHPHLDGLIHHRGHQLRPPEHIHHIDGFGNGLQVGVAGFAQHRGDDRVDRNDAVALALQILRYPVADALRVVGKPHHRNSPAFLQLLLHQVTHRGLL